MNLFLPSPSIDVSVKSLDDKRVNKMILETAQLLSTAIHIIDPNHDLTIYKTTHKNHPVSVWVRSSKDNFIFALNYFKVISEEFTFRTGKSHKSFSLYPQFVEFITSNYEFLELPNGVTPFANCTEFKEDEVHKAYKKTLVAKWSSDKLIPKWTNRTRPTWNL